MSRQQHNRVIFFVITFVLLVGIGLLVFGAVSYVWSTITTVPAKVVFFDVGQGDSILLQTNQSEQILIDGGPNNAVLQGLGEHMPFFDRTIELVIVTHPDADHVTGLVEVLQRYTVEYIVATGVVHTLPAYEAFWEQVAKQHIPVTQPRAGDVFEFDGLSMEVLWPVDDMWGLEPIGDMNDTSVVTKAQFDTGMSVLLTGDVSTAVESLLVQSQSALQSTVLKAGHHGSRTSSSYDFVRAVDPEIGVISASQNNQYGHPHYQVLRVFEKLGIPIKTTAEDGDIVFLP